MSMVSVVIPVYRTEKYLNCCVESVVNQTFRDLEILLVDDGSPDGCPELCEKWAERDKRVRVIHKKNEGLGMARNTGMDAAAGEYICFLDSDDYLAPETIACAVSRQAELVVYGFRRVGEDGRELSRRVPAAAEFRDGEVVKTFLPKLLSGEDGLQASACWALFSMALVRRAAWRFPSEREVISEDTYALLELLGHVKSVAVVDEAFYSYRQNAASLTHAYREDRFERTKTFYEKCLALCRERGYPEEAAAGCREPFLANTIAAMKQERDGQRLRRILEDSLLQQVLRERHGETAGFKRRLLVGAMAHRQYALCRLLLAAQRRKDRHR